jgi:hypothetical protein
VNFNTNCSPVALQRIQSVPPQDAAIHYLAGTNHPLQRKRLYRSHRKRLDEFIKDTGLQWDDEKYVNQRNTQAHYDQGLYATPEILKNIRKAKQLKVNTVFPRRQQRTKTPDTKLSINELQLNLSNQAAILRMEMTSEYEDMRKFQNSELEFLIKQKAAKDPKFHDIVEDVRKHVNRHQPPKSISVDKPLNREPARRPSAVELNVFPLQTMSPVELPDFNQLKHDESIPPFVKFFLDLKVVRQNWQTISQSWSNYVVILNRKLMTEHAFAKAILEDAVRTHKVDKLRSDPAHIQKTREMADIFPENMRMSKVITAVVLEMAEEGNIEFTTESVDGKDETFGPRILMDVMALESPASSVATPVSATSVGKATDPRQR